MSVPPSKTPGNPVGKPGGSGPGKAKAPAPPAADAPAIVPGAIVAKPTFGPHPGELSAMAASAGGAGGAAGMNPNDRRFIPRPPQPTLRPRKVRGGLKIESKSGPVSSAWAAQRWMRLVEDHAPGDSLAEGLVYARAGQTRTMSVMPGHISARVQGRMPTAYSVDVRLPTITFDEWEQVIAAMASEARYVANLLAGEVPASIEDLFGPLRLHLFPPDASGLSLSCSCAATRGLTAGGAGGAGMEGGAAAADPGPWCKHVCCVMALLAERLGQDTFLIFALRGLAKDELLERLRQRRTLLGNRGASTASGAGGELAVSDRPVPVYTPRLAGISDLQAPPLEQLVETFWKAPADLSDVDLSIAKPEVSHPLLRRLGPSPFGAARFPLVGLLATCYEVVSERTVATALSAGEGGAELGAGSEEGGAGEDGEGDEGLDV